MNREKLVELIFQKAKSKGIEEVEVYINKDSSINFNVYEGAIEKYVVQEEENLSLRGIYKGKMGYSYTEKFEENSLDEVVNNLVQYAENNNSDEVEKISDKVEIKPTDKDENLLDKYSEKDKMEYLLDLEKKAYEYDKRVKKVSSCSYEERTQNVYIKNTKGLELNDSHTMGILSLGAVTEEGKNMQTGYSHCIFGELKEEYKDKLIEESLGDAIAMLGAESIDSGNYDIILRNNVASDILSTFSPIFLSTQVQKNLSTLKGKIDSKIAVDILHIVEDPLMENGIYSRTFDDEGTLTSKKHIVENGVLKTFLYNNKTAEKDNIKSTGNGFRNSHKSSIGVNPTNMYIKEGEASLEDMIKEMKDGIVITDADGLHAGISPTSGNFSLLSKGLLVENGKVTKAVSQITMAGNLYDILRNIKSIGNDIKFPHPSMVYFGSPSIYVGSLAIAGK